MADAAWTGLLQQAQKSHAFMVPHLQAAIKKGCTPDNFYMPGKSPKNGQFTFLMPTHPNFLQC
jgi:hypothetical protein